MSALALFVGALAYSGMSFAGARAAWRDAGRKPEAFGRRERVAFTILSFVLAPFWLAYLATMNFLGEEP